MDPWPPIPQSGCWRRNRRVSWPTPACPRDPRAASGPSGFARKPSPPARPAYRTNAGPATRRNRRAKASSPARSSPASAPRDRRRSGARSSAGPQPRPLRSAGRGPGASVSSRQRPSRPPAAPRRRAARRDSSRARPWPGTRPRLRISEGMRKFSSPVSAEFLAVAGFLRLGQIGILHPRRSGFGVQVLPVIKHA